MYGCGCFARLHVLREEEVEKPVKLDKVHRKQILERNRKPESNVASKLQK